MIKRISHVAPLQLGTVLATLYAILSLIFVPFFLIFAMIGAHLPPSSSGQSIPAGMFGGGAVVMAIVFPILYGIFGFIAGVIAAFIYNLVAGWTGGIEFTLADVPPAIPAQTTNY